MRFGGCRDGCGLHCFAGVNSRLQEEFRVATAPGEVFADKEAMRLHLL